MERILLVEDDAQITASLSAFLQSEGYSVETATGETQARQLVEEIWDAAGDFVNDNTLTVYIKRLREKIETDPADPQIIRTVRGIGYMVDA